MREYVATAKTVEEAIQLGCEALSVDRDDLGVSYEILEMPQKTGFLGLKVTPAKVKVTVETADTEPETTPAALVAAAEPEPAPAEEAAEQPAAEDAAPAEAETPLDIAADPRLQAAVDYLTPIFHLMGVEEFTFTAGKKGEATILHVEGAHLGALIGRRGETMESLSYLASLVVNRMEGPYVKLGIDVGGYRNKREDDLTALAVRIANRVIRTGLLLRDGADEPLRAPHHPYRCGRDRGRTQREQGRRPRPPRGDLFHRPQRQQPAGS